MAAALWEDVAEEERGISSEEEEAPPMPLRRRKHFASLLHAHADSLIEVLTEFRTLEASGIDENREDWACEEVTSPTVAPPVGRMFRDDPVHQAPMPMEAGSSEGEKAPLAVASRGSWNVSARLQTAVARLASSRSSLGDAQSPDNQNGGGGVNGNSSSGRSSINNNSNSSNNNSNNNNNNSSNENNSSGYEDGTRTHGSDLFRNGLGLRGAFRNTFRSSDSNASKGSKRQLQFSDSDGQEGDFPSPGREATPQVPPRRSVEGDRDSEGNLELEGSVCAVSDWVANATPNYDEMLEGKRAFGRRLTSGSDSSTYRSEFEFNCPAAILRRYAEAEQDINKAGEFSFGDKIERGSTHRLPTSDSSLRRNEARGRIPELDARWRDLYNSIEEKAEEEEMLDNNLPKETKKRKTSIYGVTFSTSLRQRLNEDRLLFMIHPGSNFQLLWDLIGITLVLHDLLTIPIYVGWDMAFLMPETTENIVSFFVLGFWFLDIVLGFHTAYFENGSLERSRSKIQRKYLRGWFVPDLILVSIDVIFLVLTMVVSKFIDASIQTMRVVRFVRILRLLRLLKAKRIIHSIEDFLTSLGVQELILIVAVGRTLFSIFVMAHLCGCFWFYLGRRASGNGEQNWLTLISDDFESDSIPYQYTRCMYWVIGHLVAAPVDSSISPQNADERLFTMTMILFSLLVVGMGIASLTNTNAELSKMNAAAVNLRRTLQRYLTTAKVPRNLHTRVVRFALYAHQRRAAMSLDSKALELISERLRTELSVHHRSRYLRWHPLFALMSDLHAEEFCRLCEVLVPKIYADGDVVFTSGTMCETCYITHDGEFDLQIGRKTDGEPPRKFKDTRCFCEIALFGRFIHRSTLMSTVFGEAFTLTCNSLIDVCAHAPKCVETVHKFAQNYLNLLKMEAVQRSSGAEAANGTMSASVGESIDDLGTKVPELLPLFVAAKAAEEAREGHEVIDAVMLESPQTPLHDLEHFLALVGDMDADDDVIQNLLPTAFREVHAYEGVYAKLQEEDELKRSLSSMYSLIWLVRDRYDRFTENQTEKKRMTKETWDKWQKLVRWAEITPQLLHALLVFNAIRGMGKLKVFSASLPSHQRSAEDVVLHMIRDRQSVVPSTQLLDEDMIELVSITLMTLSNFSLAQMLQGENTPYQVLMLKRCVESEGIRLLHFYIMCLVGVMSGVGGVSDPNGSTFMDERMSQNVLFCIRCLQEAENHTPHTVYWGYIVAKAQQLGFDAQQEEELAIARLACVCRASPSDLNQISEAWHQLTLGDRSVLTNHFLADGIKETAFVFSFLPLYFANAKANDNVGLFRALLVLTDILQVLRVEDYKADTAQGKNVVIDLKDVAEFVREVCNPRVFLAAGAHARLVPWGKKFQLVISTKHKMRTLQTTWVGEPENEVAGLIRNLDRKISSVDIGMQKMLATPCIGTC